MVVSLHAHAMHGPYQRHNKADTGHIYGILSEDGLEP